MRLPRSKSGFTLLELAIVLGLLGFLIAGLFGGYVMVRGILLDQNSRSLKTNEVLQAVKTISEDLNNLYYEGKWNPEQIFIARKEIVQGKRVDFVNFPTARLFANPGTMQSGARMVTYFGAVDEDTDKIVLYRKEDVFIDRKHPTAGLAIPLLTDITELSVTFSLNGSQWGLDEWDYATKKNFPRHIQVNVRWQEGIQEREFIFRVNPPLLWN